MYSRLQKLEFEKQRYYFTAVDSGCYLASSKTFYCNILELGSMISTLLVSGA